MSLVVALALTSVTLLALGLAVPGLLRLMDACKLAAGGTPAPGLRGVTTATDGGDTGPRAPSTHGPRSGRGTRGCLPDNQEGRDGDRTPYNQDAA